MTSVSDRRLDAATLALLWAVGVELLPFVHVAMHAWLPTHEHGTHRHGDVEHADHADDPEHEDPTDGSHGEGSLAHRDLAMSPAAIAMPVVAVARVAIPSGERGPALAVESATAGAPRARGPPA